MSILAGLATFIVWATVVPLGVLAGLIFLIIGLSTDDRDMPLRRQRLRMALLFTAIPVGGAITLTVITAVLAMVEAAVMAG